MLPFALRLLHIVYQLITKGFNGTDNIFESPPQIGQIKKRKWLAYSIVIVYFALCVSTGLWLGFELMGEFIGSLTRDTKGTIFIVVVTVVFMVGITTGMVIWQLPVYRRIKQKIEDNPPPPPDSPMKVIIEWENKNMDAITDEQLAVTGNSRRLLRIFLIVLGGALVYCTVVVLAGYFLLR
jgi:hypothetical protein